MRMGTLLLFLIMGFARGEDAYQLLRSEATGYASVKPDRSLSFPEDHLPHPDYRIEWWYLTANLTDNDGQHWGVHWTLFRQSLSPEPDPGDWSSDQLWMAHAALSTPEGHHRYEERFARGGIGQAGVDISDNLRFEAWLDDWQLKGPGPAPLPGSLVFTIKDARVHLTLEADTPWVLQGDEGYSQKSDQGQASYYYSQPHIRIQGTLTTGQEQREVRGLGWLDREWSSQPLAPNQPGWDWFALHLDDGHALMVYRLRQDNNKDWISGSWVRPDGSSQTLRQEDIDLQAIARTDIETGAGESKTLPLEWTVSLPKLDRHWRITARHEDQWLDTAFPYWEGPIQVKGTPDGVGYMELTGY